MMKKAELCVASLTCAYAHAREAARLPIADLADLFHKTNNVTNITKPPTMAFLRQCL
jgi:hypothetical protein